MFHWAQHPVAGSGHCATLCPALPWLRLYSAWWLLSWPIWCRQWRPQVDARPQNARARNEEALSRTNYCTRRNIRP